MREDGATWLTRCGPDPVFVHQEDAPDKHGVRKGQWYAERLALLVPGLRCVGVSRVYAALGIPWKAGDDLAGLSGRGIGLPIWRDVLGNT